MAFAASGGLGPTLKDIFGNDTAVDWPGSASDWKVALFTSTITVAATTYDTATAYGVAPFNANEVPNGSGYTTGGKVLTTLTSVLTPSTQLQLDAADLAWAAATFSAVNGCLIYDDVITTPTADPGLIGVTFGAPFAVTGGTFTIQWNALGIATLDYA